MYKMLKNIFKQVYVLLLECLGLIPDKTYLKIKYFVKFRKKLDVDNPLTFNEKIQWLKLYDRKPQYTEMADKYKVKKIVSDLIGEEHIVPNYGVWDRFEDINFEELPDQFVLKCTHDSGSVLICRNKEEFNKKYARMHFNLALKRNYFWGGREWCYKNIKPRIIAEKYLPGLDNQIVDFKFFCFGGRPRYVYVSAGLENHSTARISFCNLDYTLAPFQRSDYAQFEVLPPKPAHYDEMIEIATKLSMGTTLVRIDLYECDDKVLFSEMTFYPVGGFMPFVPEEWDKKLGDLVCLSNS